MGKKPSGRKERRYTIAQPPRSGCAIVRVDDHTATIRSADYLATEDLAFLADVLDECQRARRAGVLDPEAEARGIPPPSTNL